MVKKKVFVYLPDGVGLRNFAFTKFKDLGESKDYEIVYWNNTDFNLEEEFGYNELKTLPSQVGWKTTILKRAMIKIELLLFKKKFKDNTFLTYIFPQNYSGVKNAFKSLLVDCLVAIYKSNKGKQQIESRINKFERNSSGYAKARNQLEAHQPDLVFCTNQRASEAIASILAAQDLGIKTVAFIYSWDNLPKATKIIDTDYYFVWSDYMKKELMLYYPEVKAEQIIVTGTPQFEPHFDQEMIMSKEEFFKQHDLDLGTRYICFSGDDITTSPFDEHYLKDTLEAVSQLNDEGHKVGVIFRRCPVDFSSRYNSALESHKDYVRIIAPDWTKKGEGWNTVMPTPNDMRLLVNTSKYCKAVINIGSSMVFDFVAHKNACMYLNYDHSILQPEEKHVEEIYNYIHFRSMPTNKAVIWINKKEEIKTSILHILEEKITNIEGAQQWFETINIKQANTASEKIWKGIEQIIAH